MAKQMWRMRYSGHLGLRGPDTPLFRQSVGSADPLLQIDFLAGLGFAGVQDGFIKLRPAAEQARIGAALAHHGLAMGSFTNNPGHWNTPLWSRSDEEARALLRADFDASIAMAALTGAKTANCVTGLDPDRSPALQRAGMIENLKALADEAAAHGMTLGIEPVAQGWIPGLLIDRLDDALAVINGVNHPAVRLIFDFGHIQMSEGNAEAELNRVWDYVGAIQLADSPGRIDLGAGTLDWPSIFKSIRARNWSGLLEIEHMPMDETAEGEARLLSRLSAIDHSL